MNGHDFLYELSNILRATRNDDRFPQFSFPLIGVEEVLTKHGQIEKIRVILGSPEGPLNFEIGGE